MLSSHLFSKEHKTLICTSIDQIEEWDGGDFQTKIQFLGYFDSDKFLSKAKVRGAYHTDIKSIIGISRESDFEGFLEYEQLEDAWSHFTLIIPNSLKSNRFKGFVRIESEEEHLNRTYEMDCFIKRH